MWIVALAAAFAAAPPTGDAQLYTTPYFHSFGIASGMPSSRVYKTVQDRDGYLWFGTQDGLARYDGSAFRVWRHDPKLAESLGGDVVSALYVDRENRIWCGAEESGLNLLDTRRAAFVHYRHDAKDPASLASDDVWAITEDSAGALWVGSYAGGVDKLLPAATGFAHYRHDAADPHSLVSDNIIGLLASRDGRLWVGSDAGVDVIESGGAIRHADFSAVPGSGAVNAASLVETEDGTILAGTRRGLLRIDAALHAGVATAAELSDRIVYAVAGGRQGELWIATRHGLDRRDSDGAIWTYKENPSVPGSFPGDTVFDAMRDREGNLWFATFEGGVAQLPASWRNFATFRNDPGDPGSLSANRTQGLGADGQGRLWAVNLEGGIDRLDPASGRIERFAGRLPPPDKGLWSVLADRHEQLWVGHGHGIRVYKLQNAQFTDIAVGTQTGAALAPGLAYHLAEDPAGPVWASTYGSSGAVHRIDPLSLQVERFDAANAGLRNAEVDQLGFAGDGSLWVASGAGLDRFDAATRRFVAIAGAPSRRVYAFAFAADGTLWLHVLGALEHYRLAGAALVPIERIDADAGWPALTVGGLQVDGAGAIWVSSARGLWRYDPRTHAIRTFDSRDGLASSEFNRLELVRRADGAIFGGTLAGIVGFRPAQIAENPPPPSPLIDTIVVRRAGVDQSVDPRAGELALRWDDRDVRVTARALSYANSGANRYRWQLVGLDTAWVDTASRGEREFPQLPPGDYRLRLQAAGASGLWSAAVEPLLLRVAAPPWATPLAYAAYVVLLVLLLLMAFRAYRARIRRRYTLALAEQQRQFAEQSNAAKTRFLATMGHEIRTPMTGVLGMTELLLRTPLDPTQQGYARTILDSGRMMLRLVNDSLDLARIEAGKLELEEVAFDVRGLLGEIAAVAAPLARAKGLAWTFDAASDLPETLRGDPVRIKQILLNLVNNAIKFTEHGSIGLWAQGGIDFAVTDTGPGIAESTRRRLFQRFEQADGAQRHGGSGLGLAICRELVARMGGSIALDSEPGRGSTFRVHLPLASIDPDTDADADADGVRQAPLDAAVAGPSRHVLLVEDDATVAAVLSGLLAAHGHRVTHAAQGLAALAEFDTATFDLALVDLDLPGVDGLALARLLRAREAQRVSLRTRLIGISARSAGDEEALCRDAGMDGFLRKPLTGAMLERAIAELARP